MTGIGPPPPPPSGFPRPSGDGPQPPSDAPRQAPDLFSTRYVVSDDDSQRQARGPVARTSRSTKLSGSRYVPIDGTAALSARPSLALAAAAIMSMVAAIGLAAVWAEGTDLALAVAGALVLMAVAAWRFGTDRMAAVALVVAAGTFSLIAGGALVFEARADDDPAIAARPDARETDFDLLYDQCQRENYIACDLLYNASWTGTVREDLAQALPRDCAGRGPVGEGFCAAGLVDIDGDGFAETDAPGWPAITAACTQGDMLACDLAATRSLDGTTVASVGTTCGSRVPFAASTCRAEFGPVADE